MRNGTNKGQLVVGVYYRPPDQGKPVDNAFFLQMQEGSHSHALILMGDFNTQVFAPKQHGKPQEIRRHMESIDDTCLIQILNRLIRGEALLDLVLINVEEIIKNIKIRGSLSRNRGLVEFMILRNVGLVNSGVWRAKFRLFKELLNKMSWEEVLRDKEVKQSCLLFKDGFRKFKSSPALRMIKQAEEAGNQHGLISTCLSN